MGDAASWDEIVAAAQRLDREFGDSPFTVAAARRRYLNRWAVREGLHLGNRWTDVFEDVRVRRFFSTRWTTVQTVASAETCIREFADRLTGERDRSSTVSIEITSESWSPGTVAPQP
jgi:hypothetical protein